MNTLSSRNGLCAFFRLGDIVVVLESSIDSDLMRLSVRFPTALSGIFAFLTLQELKLVSSLALASSLLALSIDASLFRNALLTG